MPSSDKKKSIQVARQAVEEARKAVGNINFHEADPQAKERSK
ncbi:hypothetical protein [Halalkalibacter alkalisediminis]|uniref:Uncharacterized protein n=1 Tax=Halalkalibacter alkalisediminis TaxID=935616 RepID=A0ABV6NI35_9BACI|nr:hypothetical protein [Halalkalibacter alkalisediminis]